MAQTDVYTSGVHIVSNIITFSLTPYKHSFMVVVN